MDLHIALRTIIETEGQEIINDVRIVNILDDFKAYDTLPPSKYILRAIILDGFTKKLLIIGAWNTNSHKLCQQFIMSTGFQSEYVNFVFKSLAYGLKYINKLDNDNERIAPKSNYTKLQSNYIDLTLRSSQLGKKSDDFLQKYKEDAQKYLDSLFEIKGDINNNPTAIFKFSSEYDPADNTFCVNIEIEGKVTYKFTDSYSDMLVFRIVLYDEKNRVITKEEADLYKKNFNKTYQVLGSNYFYEKDYKFVSNIKRIVVFWEEI